MLYDLFYLFIVMNVWVTCVYVGVCLFFGGGGGVMFTEARLNTHAPGRQATTLRKTVRGICMIGTLLVITLSAKNIFHQ